MKKQILLCSILLAFVAIAYGAAIRNYNAATKTGVPVLKFSNVDTLKYLEDHFIARKNQFQNHELKQLLNELNLSIKSYLIIRPHKPTDAYRGVILFFEDKNPAGVRRGSKDPHLKIIFENDIPKGKALVLFGRSGGQWGNNEETFYGPMIIKDIAAFNKQK